MTREETRGPAHRGRHPLGRVPVIEDDAGFLFESVAIVLALADRHPEADLGFPVGTRERELVYQWVLFAMLEIERPASDFRDAGDDAPERRAAAGEHVARAAAVVEEALRGHDFLVGDRLSAADIVVGPVLAFARRVGALEDSPEVSRYLEALDQRPAHRVAYDPGAR
jgi:glutathione S-transferase